MLFCLLSFIKKYSNKWWNNRVSDNYLFVLSFKVSFNNVFNLVTDVLYVDLFHYGGVNIIMGDRWILCLILRIEWGSSSVWHEFFFFWNSFLTSKCNKINGF